MTACTYVEQIRPAHLTAKTTIEAATCSNRPIINGYRHFHPMHSQHFNADSYVLDREVWRDSESQALSSLQNYCVPAYYRVT